MHLFELTEFFFSVVDVTHVTLIVESMASLWSMVHFSSLCENFSIIKFLCGHYNIKRVQYMHYYTRSGTIFGQAESKITLNFEVRTPK